MDLDTLEALALSDDRAALSGLLPGTVDHDYWRGVHLQHQGSFAAVDVILAEWWNRHREQGTLFQRLKRRQLFLRAGVDLEGYADALRLEAGISLDDQAEAVAAAHQWPSRLDPATVDEGTVTDAAFRRAADLSCFTDWALTDLVPRADRFDPTRRRDLLRRLPRANMPGVVALVAAELGDPSSRGFSALPTQRLLTLDQLVELGRLIPAVCQDGGGSRRWSPGCARPRTSTGRRISARGATTSTGCGRSPAPSRRASTASGRWCCTTSSISIGARGARTGRAFSGTSSCPGKPRTPIRIGRAAFPPTRSCPRAEARRGGAGSIPSPTTSGWCETSSPTSWRARRWTPSPT